MKIPFLITLIAGPLLANAGINGTTPSGDMLRAVEFVEIAAPQAALQQLASIYGDTQGYSDDMERMWLQGQALYDVGRYAEAMEAYDAFENRYPESPLRTLCRAYRGDCLFALGRYNEAVAIYAGIDTDVLLPAQSDRLYYHAAICAMHQGNYDSALQYFGRVGVGAYASAARFYSAVIHYRDGSYDKVRALLKNVDTTRAPGDMAPYYMASVELAQGNCDAALAAARTMLGRKLSPQAEAEMHRVAGEALFRNGERTQAGVELERYMAYDDGAHPEAYYMAGVIEYDRGNYARAVELLDRATASNDADMLLSTYLYIGQALHHRGDNAAAILAFDKALKTGGNDREARQAAFYNYAVASSTGAGVPFASGAQTFEDFLSQYPSGPYSDRVRAYLAEGYMADKNYERALERINAITATDAAAVRSMRQRLLYLCALQNIENADYDKAASYLTQASAIGNADATVAAECLLLQAQVAAAKGRNDEAATLYRKYLSSKDKKTNAVVARYGLGYALMATGQYAGAKTAFEDIESDKTLSAAQHADVVNRLADIAFAERDFDTAASLYARAAAISPATADYATFHGARMLGFARNYAGKLDAIDSFLERFPQSVLAPEALLERSQALISLGRNKDAIANYRRLTDSYPATPQARQGLLEMAMTMLDAGNGDDAIATYRTIISQYPTSDEAAQAASLLKNLYVSRGRGDLYLSFMESIDNAPAVNADEAQRIACDAAMAAMERGEGTAAIERYIERYPDGSGTPGALLVLAKVAYEAGDIPRALQQYTLAEQRATDATMATDARLGIMRSARDMGQYDLAAATARTIINSSATAAATDEASYTLAVALHNDGNDDEAIGLWLQLATQPKTLFGAKSAFHAARALMDAGQTDKALATVQTLTGSGSGHSYWVARGFILQSDIYNAMGRCFEAREYLEALRDNYPGKEADIFSMIEERLNQLK